MIIMGSAMRTYTTIPCIRLHFGLSVSSSPSFQSTLYPINRYVKLYICTLHLHLTCSWCTNTQRTFIMTSGTAMALPKAHSQRNCHRDASEIRATQHITWPTENPITTCSMPQNIMGHMLRSISAFSCAPRLATLMQGF